MNDNCCCDFFPGTQYCAICQAEAGAEAKASTGENHEAPTVDLFHFLDLIGDKDKPKRSSRRKNTGTVLPEVEIIDVYEIPDQDKRVKVRTRKGLFCCYVSHSGGFKVKKVLRTKLAHRQLEIPTVDEEFSSYNGPEQFTPEAYDWKAEFEALMREIPSKETPKLRVISPEQFLKAIQIAQAG